MTQTLTPKDRYLADFQTFDTGAATAGQPEWLRQRRQAAFAQYKSLGMPTARRGNELWKYTNIRALANTAFEHGADGATDAVSAAGLRRLAPWHDSWASAVFVDGRFSEKLSTMPPGGDGVRVMSLSRAVTEHGDILERHLAQHAPTDVDAFAALNTAFMGDGAFVYVPKDAVGDRTLHIVFVSTAEGGPTVSHPRTLIVTERFSKVTVIESYVGETESPYFSNGVTEIVVGEGASVEHYRLLLDGTNAYHVGTTQIVQGRDSNFSSLSLEMGSSLGRYNLTALLDEPGSRCNLFGLYMTNGDQHIDNNINIDHAKPHATSRLFYKGILAGRSRVIFGGTVTVRKDAQKTDAQQKDKNLLLSREAEVDSKPALYIYADDVKCGHGATAGYMDDEAVFYMQSRGIDTLTARKMLVRAFASEVLNEVRMEPLREYVEGLFESYEESLDLLPEG